MVYNAGAAFVGGDGGTGPVGCGIFARDATTTRVTTGATHGGIMEMSGNLMEPVVSVGDGSTASTYTGVWGDGILNASAVFNTALWPAMTGAVNNTYTITFYILVQYIVLS